MGDRSPEKVQSRVSVEVWLKLLMTLLSLVLEFSIHVSYSDTQSTLRKAKPSLMHNSSCCPRCFILTELWHKTYVDKLRR